MLRTHLKVDVKGCLGEFIAASEGRGRRAVSASSGRSALSRTITGGPHTHAAGLPRAGAHLLIHYRRDHDTQLFV